MVSGILALLQSLPEILKLLNRLGDLTDRFLKWSNANNLNGWINNLEAHIDALEKAKTQDEKFAAAAGLASSIRNLPQ